MTEQAGAAVRASRKPAKGRSPSYPGISLKAAIERARQVYETEKRHAAPMGAITATWGYKSPTTGPASVTFSAVKKFGLLKEEERSGDARMARLTPLALEILMSPDPHAAVQRAALLPPIHREMWETYGASLPSAESLRWRLVGQKGFTESGFEEFLREYRETVAFAELDETTQVPTDASGEDEDEVDGDDDGEDLAPMPGRAVSQAYPGQVGGQRVRRGWEQPAPTQPHGDRIQLRLAGGEVVYLEGTFPISEAAFVNLLQILDVMRPGLVRDDAAPNEHLARYDADEAVRVQ